jgi:hypothetical protein
MVMPQVSRPLSAAGKKGFRLTEHKFLLLFVYMLAALLYYPYVKEDTSSYFFFRLVGSAGIVLTLYAINLRRMLLLCAILLAIPALLQRMLLPQIDGGRFSVATIALSFLFDVFVVVVISRRVFSQDRPDAEGIAAALCIYLVLGFAFASIYGILASLQPNAFYLNPSTNLHSTPSRFDVVYFSFATLTSMGANGMTAVTDQVRSIAIVESTVGLLYIAVLISRLISAYRSPADC